MLKKLIVLVEEPSTEVVLQHLLPKMLVDAEFEIRRFQCKDDLLKNLPARLRGYSTWIPSDNVILVLLDRDDENCVALKHRLERTAAAAGLLTKSQAGVGKPFQVVNRIAIEELEAWFFGDWAAVQTAFPRVQSTQPGKAGFRDPDAVIGGTWETFERVLKRAGYFKTGLRKVECARLIGEHMNPAKNSSKSFQAFVEAVASATAQV